MEKSALNLIYKIISQKSYPIQIKLYMYTYSFLSILHSIIKKYLLI